MLQRSEASGLSEAARPWHPAECRAASIGRGAGPALTEPVDDRAARPAGAAARRRALGVRARGRRHDPGRIRLSRALSRRDRPAALEDRIAVYLRAGQAEHGGWPLYPGGDFDLSATVKAYFALKLIGDDPAAPHMRRARAGDPRARRGGALQRVHPDHARSVRPGALARRAGDAGRDHAAAALVPVPPRQGVLLVARTVILPLLILMALKPRARNPRGVGIAELFVTPPDRRAPLHHQPDRRRAGAGASSAVDRLLRLVEPRWPRAAARAGRSAGRRLRHRATERRGRPRRHLPAMANTVMAFDALGYAEDHPDLADRQARGAQAASSSAATRLLPALPVAGLGHSARLPRAHGGERREPVDASVRRGARLARSTPDPGRGRRLGGRPAQRASGRLAVRVSQRLLPERRRAAR